MAEKVGFISGYCRIGTFMFWMKVYVNIYPKVVGDLNINGNIPGILLKKLEKSWKYRQGGHGTGKTGNLVLTFSRQGKHKEFCYDTGKVFETQGKYF